DWDRTVLRSAGARELQRAVPQSEHPGPMESLAHFAVVVDARSRLPAIPAAGDGSRLVWGEPPADQLARVAADDGPHGDVARFTAALPRLRLVSRGNAGCLRLVQSMEPAPPGHTRHLAHAPGGRVADGQRVLLRVVD